MSSIAPARPEAPQPAVLWAPTQARIEASRLADYQRWLSARHGLAFDSYASLWEWSTEQLDAFWRSIFDYFDVLADGSASPVLGARQMPGAQWFPNVRLNYAEHVFRQADAGRPALIVRDEQGEGREVSWSELRRVTAALAATLKAHGVRPGDRVASYLPNRPETVAAFLACASLGAIWSSCAPDMGPAVLMDRWSQIEPTVLIATDSYSYNGKLHDRAETVAHLLRALPSVRTMIHVPGPLALNAQNGSMPYVLVQMSSDMSHCETSNSGGVGPNYGAYTPPRLVQ